MSKLSRICICLFIATACGSGNTVVAQDEQPKKQGGAGVLSGSGDESSAENELRSQINRLVEQLDADSLLDRNDAEKGLIALGPKILDYLPLGAGESRKRLNSIRNQLQLNSIMKSVESSRVTLQGDMTVFEALKSMSDQTGNQFTDIENYDAMINVSLEDDPFWRGVDSVLDAAGLTIDDYEGEGKALALIPRGFGLPRTDSAQYLGIFRISKSRLSLTRDYENPSRDLLRVTVKLAWEPRLQPITIGMPVDGVKITDDVGDAVELAIDQGTIGSPTQGQSTVELTLPMRLPSPEATHVDIEADIEALVPGRTEDFEFSNLLESKGREVRHGMATATFEGIRPNNDLHVVRVLVRFEDPDKSLESHRAWIYANDAVLVTPDGVELEWLNREMYSQDDGAVGFQYIFDVQEIPEDLRLIYRSPAAVVRLPVKLKLSKIELP